MPTPFLPRRRSLLLGSLGSSALLLSGCVPELTRPDSSQGYGTSSQRAAGRQRARDIFTALDNHQPIPLSGSEGLRPLQVQYEEGKRRFDALVASQGKGVELEQFLHLVGGPLAGYTRGLFEEALRSDLGKAAPATAEKPRFERGVFHIPHGYSIRYVQKGYCMDPNLPAPGKNDALELRPVADRVPGELQPLFKAVGRWAARPENRSKAQAATWAIMGAGTNSPWANNISRDALRVLDEALPGGADTFRNYHQRNQLVNSLFNIRINGQTIRASDIADPARRDKIAGDLLGELTRLGERMPEGKGIGYAELESGVVARAWGESSLTPQVEVANVSGKPVIYDPLDYFAAPVVAKQSVSGTQDISNPRSTKLDIAEPNDKQATHELGANLFKDHLKYQTEKGLLPAFTRFLGDSKAVVSKKVSKFLQARGVPKSARTVAIKGLQGLLSATPVVGNVLSLYECVTGRDWLTGEDLTAAERLLAGMGTIPGANTLKGIAGSLRAVNPASSIARQLETWQRGSQVFRLADQAEPYLSGYNLFLSGSAKELNTMIRGENDPVVRAFNLNDDTKKTLVDLTMADKNFMPWNEPTRQVIDWVRTGQVTPK